MASIARSPRRAARTAPNGSSSPGLRRLITTAATGTSYPPRLEGVQGELERIDDVELDARGLWEGVVGERPAHRDRRYAGSDGRSTDYESQCSEARSRPRRAHLTRARRLPR
jgi:hypothetical protein